MNMVKSLILSSAAGLIAMSGAQAADLPVKAKAVEYVSAGTIEGLFVKQDDGPDEYFFLEMNTRVQVEHCVTEMTTGIDIVREGILAAAGEPEKTAETTKTKPG